MRVDSRPIELTLPDSDIYIPEFGLCLPPELMMDFDDRRDTLTPAHRDEIDFALNLSDPLQTPPHGEQMTSVSLDTKCPSDTIPTTIWFWGLL